MDRAPFDIFRLHNVASDHLLTSLKKDVIVLSLSVCSSLELLKTATNFYVVIRAKKVKLVRQKVLNLKVKSLNSMTSSGTYCVLLSSSFLFRSEAHQINTTVPSVF